MGTSKMAGTAHLAANHSDRMSGLMREIVLGQRQDWLEAHKLGRTGFMVCSRRGSPRSSIVAAALNAGAMGYVLKSNTSDLLAGLRATRQGEQFN
jgi:hypothetical protein